MVTHDAPLARPSAEWISRYASGLLQSTPGLQPLDAVRRAMDASVGASGARADHEAKAPTDPQSRRR